MHEKRVSSACHRFTCGFLEHAGCPRLSVFAGWRLLCGAARLVGVARRLAGK